jgi:hypothetical protein
MEQGSKDILTYIFHGKQSLIHSGKYCSVQIIRMAKQVQSTAAVSPHHKEKTMALSKHGKEHNKVKMTNVPFFSLAGLTDAS